MRTRPSLGAALVALTLPALFPGCSGDSSKKSVHSAKGLLQQSDPFVSGREDYDTFRIPSLLVTKKGTLLAFCEGRKNSSADHGDIDVVLKRSTDQGKKWSDLQVVADDGANTVGNPCPVVDQSTGTIWLLLTHNLGEDKESQITTRRSKGTRRVWLSHSTDDGVTWTKPEDITATTKRPEWTWYATGPGCGIQLKSGRMVIPCDHTPAGARDNSRSHVIYSDDHGATWKIGGIVDRRVNECQVVERVDGSLMLNMRNCRRGVGETYQRAIAISRDGGLNWADFRYDPTLIEPICQASLVRHTGAGAAANTLIFANPASTKREKLTVRLSNDGGETWAASKELWSGPAAYSALAAFPDGTVGCLYERGEKNPYSRIAYARFNLDWIKSPAEAR
ncbi:MAG: exo-alpha-sialidase [Phycisphaerae bacterium]|nr:exo-alpha-sialidase [Phycisphaerae bacterium]